MERLCDFSLRNFMLLFILGQLKFLRSTKLDETFDYLPTERRQMYREFEQSKGLAGFTFIR